MDFATNRNSADFTKVQKEMNFRNFIIGERIFFCAVIKATLFIIHSSDWCSVSGNMKSMTWNHLFKCTSICHCRCWVNNVVAIGAILSKSHHRCCFFFDEKRKTKFNHQIDWSIEQNGIRKCINHFFTL